MLIMDHNQVGGTSKIGEGDEEAQTYSYKK